MARPTKLTPALQQKFCEAIRAGNHYDVAAPFAGIDKRTLHRWMKSGARATRGHYRLFYLAVQKALADAEARCVAIVNKAAADDWRAAAWYLERKAADRWGRKDRIQATVQGRIAHAHLDVGHVDLSNLADEELDALEQIYAKILPPFRVEPGDGTTSGEGGEGTA